MTAFVTESFAYSAAEIRESARKFQSLIVWGKKLFNVRCCSIFKFFKCFNLRIKLTSI